MKTRRGQGTAAPASWLLVCFADRRIMWDVQHCFSPEFVCRPNLSTSLRPSWKVVDWAESSCYEFGSNVLVCTKIVPFRLSLSQFLVVPLHGWVSWLREAKVYTALSEKTETWPWQRRRERRIIVPLNSQRRRERRIIVPLNSQRRRERRIIVPLNSHLQYRLHDLPAWGNRASKLFNYCHNWWFSAWPYARVQTGGFFLFSGGPKMCLGEAEALLGGPGGMFPRENFGKMEPNPAILCILAVKTEWLQHGPLTRSTQKLKKIKFRSVERTLWPRGSLGVLPTSPPPPPETPLGTGLLWPFVHSYTFEILALLPNNPPECSHRVWSRSGRKGVLVCGITSLRNGLMGQERWCSWLAPSLLKVVK